jgi:hypothetical protein
MDFGRVLQINQRPEFEVEVRSPKFEGREAQRSPPGNHAVVTPNSRSYELRASLSSARKKCALSVL